MLSGDQSVGPPPRRHSRAPTVCRAQRDGRSSFCWGPLSPVTRWGREGHFFLSLTFPLPSFLFCPLYSRFLCLFLRCLSLCPLLFLHYDKPAWEALSHLGAAPCFPGSLRSSSGKWALRAHSGCVEGTASVRTRCPTPCGARPSERPVRGP